MRNGRGSDRTPRPLACATSAPGTASTCKARRQVGRPPPCCREAGENRCRIPTSPCRRGCLPGQCCAQSPTRVRAHKPLPPRWFGGLSTAPHQQVPSTVPRPVDHHPRPALQVASPSTARTRNEGLLPSPVPPSHSRHRREGTLAPSCQPGTPASRLRGSDHPK